MFSSFNDNHNEDQGLEELALGGNVFRSAEPDDLDIPPPPLSVRNKLGEDSMGLGDTFRSAGTYFDTHDDFAHEHTNPQHANKFDSWSGPQLGHTKDLYPSLAPNVKAQPSFNFLDFGESLDSTTRAALKKAPLFYSKNSSFISNSSHVDLLRDLDDILKTSETVVHDYSEHKNKVKGIIRCCHSQESCHFVVKVFDHCEGSLLVEVQNRGGCVVTFSNFYRMLLGQLSSLSDTHFVRRVTAPEGSVSSGCPDAFEQVQSLTALPLPVLDDDDETSKEVTMEREDLVLSLATRLLEDANCQFLETQREAVSTLASMMAVPTNTKNVLPKKRDDILEVLRVTLRSPDDVVLGHACSLLVNICSLCSQSRALVCSDMLSNLFEVLDSPGSLENRACKRRIAEALVLLSDEPCHAKRLKASHTTLQKYQGYDDLCLKRSIATTLQRVEAA